MILHILLLRSAIMLVSASLYASQVVPISKDGLVSVRKSPFILKEGVTQPHDPTHLVPTRSPHSFGHTNRAPPQYDPGHHVTALKPRLSEDTRDAIVAGVEFFSYTGGLVIAGVYGIRHLLDHHYAYSGTHNHTNGKKHNRRRKSSKDLQQTGTSEHRVVARFPKVTLKSIRTGLRISVATVATLSLADWLINAVQLHQKHLEEQRQRQTLPNQADDDETKRRRSLSLGNFQMDPLQNDVLPRFSEGLVNSIVPATHLAAITGGVGTVAGLVELITYVDKHHHAMILKHSPQGDERRSQLALRSPRGNPNWLEDARIVTLRLGQGVAIGLVGTLLFRFMHKTLEKERGQQQHGK